MIFPKKRASIISTSSLIAWGIWFLCPFLLVSCFTGIESTKKISLSREDKKLAEKSPEEKFMDRVQPQDLQSWQQGKRFIVSDDKALLVIKPREGLLPVAPDSVKGKILEFDGVESNINAAGDLTVSLVFTDGIFIYHYDTGKEFQDAMANFKSDQIPMLIDEDMVNDARNLLIGKTLWSKSPLWYDNDGNRIPGKKFVEVEIVNVEPGNLVFPLIVEISDQGAAAFLYMNFGSADNESRAFSNLFSLSDIKKHYPAIDNETWEFISVGKVKEGMTKEECRLSLGNPSDSNSGHDYSQTIDIWTYDNGTVLWFEDGRLVKTRL